MATIHSIVNPDGIANSTESESALQQHRSICHDAIGASAPAVAVQSSGSSGQSSGGSQAMTDIHPSTPLSSLPSSGSLMRHLFELRRRQQEQRRKLEESIQTASPILTANLKSYSNEKLTKNDSLNNYSEDSDIKRPSPIYQTDVDSTGYGFKDTRKPLTKLPTNIGNTDVGMKTTLSSKMTNLSRIPHYDATSAENCPPQTVGAVVDAPSVIPKKYNPNIYRSPPKPGKANTARNRKINTKDDKDLPVQIATQILPSSNKSSSIKNSHFIDSEALCIIASPDDTDRPISSLSKSFEELILDKIKAGEYRCSPTDTPAPTKNFLAKGSGKSRFLSSKDQSYQTGQQHPLKEMCGKDDETTPRVKVKFPYLKRGAGTSRFNYEPAKLKKTISSVIPKAVQQNKPVEKLTLKEPFTNDSSTPLDKRAFSQLSNKLHFNGPGSVEVLSPILQRYPKRELEALRAFEKLEELAENTSFSSTGSTVNSLLQKGLNSSISSTPINSPIHFSKRGIFNHAAVTYDKQSQYINNINSGTSPQMQNDVTVKDVSYEPVNYDNLESIAHQVAGISYARKVTQPEKPMMINDNVKDGDKKKRTVQFCDQGVQIMEYCVNDCETESEAPTMSDTSEMLNTSDLEALNQLHQEGKLPSALICAQYVSENTGTEYYSPIVPDYIDKGTLSWGTPTHESENDGSYDTALGSPLKFSDSPAADNVTNNRPPDKVMENVTNMPPPEEVMQSERKNMPPRHTVLQFSPPRMPPNAASYPVWEAFGKRPNKCVKSIKSHALPAPRPTKYSSDPAEVVFQQSNPHTRQKSAVEVKSVSKDHEDLESHKVLLIAKVHELENEISTFQRENSQLQRLKETLNREKQQLNKERREFELTLTEDRRRMEEYFEAEKNKLWKEKTLLKSNKQNELHINYNLEIINLKEEILLLKKELDKRDSIHIFTVNKLKEKIKELDSQKKDIEKKAEKLSGLEKENMSLKHQVDRLKLTKKIGYQKNSTNRNQSTKPLPNKSSKFIFTSQPKDISIVDVNPRQRNSSFFTDLKTTSASNTPEQGSLKSSINSNPYNICFSNMSSNENNSPNTHSLTSNYATPDSNVAGVSSDLTNSLDFSEVKLADGSKVLTYANGNKKQILASGGIIHEYYNGDRKETYSDRVIYTYSETGTKQTSFQNGVEEVLFANGQKEIRRPDGTVEVQFPDGSQCRTQHDSSVVHYSTDGTVITTDAHGEKLFQFPNGQREIHGDGFMRREFPDGTRKVIYSDGTAETTYPNGRIRVKDKQGNIISDTKLGINITSAQV